MVGKAQKSHGARSGLYDGCSDRVPPSSVSSSIGTFQSRNADAPLRLFRHRKKVSIKTTVTPFSRSGWSVVRNISLAKGGTSKKRPSPHLHKVLTGSNKASPRTLQSALVYMSIFHEVDGAHGNARATYIGIYTLQYYTVQNVT
jgi:hypothetical protein